MYDEMHLLLKKNITNDKCRKTRWVVGGGDGEGDLDGVAGGGARGGGRTILHFVDARQSVCLHAWYTTRYSLVLINS